MNLLALMDVYDGNISIGGEVRLNKTWSVIMDAGYIFYSDYINKADKTRGIVLRPGVRLYAGKLKSMFIDMQLHYKGVRYYVNDWVDKDVVNNVAAYQEQKEFQVQKRVTGGQIMMGAKEFLSSDYTLFLEFFLGVGLHYKEESLYKESDSQYEHGFGIFRSSTLTSRKTTQVAPALPFGVRLVYTIR